MPVDQAAGLRRRGTQQPLRGIHCFFATAAFSLQLAQALHRLGQTALLVDMRGRLFAGSTTRSLFDWRQQLARGKPHTLPLDHCEGWHAPGLQADAPGLRAVAHAYDSLLFDAGASETILVLMPDAEQSAAIEVRSSQESMRHAFALLKTLAGTGGCLRVGLLGDAAACDHVLGACRHFLEQQFVRSIYNAAHEDDAFSALAVRMSGMEASLTARYKTGIP